MNASPTTTWTVRELLDWTTERLSREGIVDPRTDAQHLLAHVLGCTRLHLYLDHDRVVDDAARGRFRELVRRRLDREPVAYIRGRRGFHALDLELEVDTRVLVPRPETELLVDWVLEDLRPPPAPPQHAIDVGTGSGAIALALARARPDLEVAATDVSTDALAVARANAERLGARVRFFGGDLLAGVPRPESGWDAIVANLPYVRTADIAALEPEVGRHEPRVALDGGPDGLRLLERLVAEVGRDALLSPRGALFLEIGIDQAEAVAAALAQAGLADVAVRRDLAGHPRMVRGRRPPV